MNYASTAGGGAMGLVFRKAEAKAAPVVESPAADVPAQKISLRKDTAIVPPAAQKAA
ncbi:MAG TPA: hypothetical protein VIG74_03025 [Alphaproteobacteria bacterium]